MKLVRFLYKKNVSWGILEGNRVVFLKEPPYRRIRRMRLSVALSKVKLLAPAEPSKVVCAGLNYRDHASELNMPLSAEPVIFIKPSTSVIACGEKIIYPRGVKRLDYEAELAIVIKRRCRNILPGNVGRYILGYTCLNDVTARDLQKKDSQWTRAKSFDTFCPIGPYLDTAFQPAGRDVRLYLNDQLKQDSSTSNFIYGIGHLVSFISRVMTLLPGDVISTGTPPGVGPMRKGDVVRVEIDGLGCLRNLIF